MTPKDFKQKAKYASRWFVVESPLKAGEMMPTSPGLPSICNTSYLIVLLLAFTSFITRQMRDLPASTKLTSRIFKNNLSFATT